MAVGGVGVVDAHEWVSGGGRGAPVVSAVDGVIHSVALPTEIAQLERLQSRGVDCATKLLFCVKEATYKAWFPLTHRWLGFEQAEIDVRDDGTCTSYLLVRPTPVPLIEGRWQITNGYIVVATYVT